VGVPHNGHSRCTTSVLSAGKLGTPHNGHSRCLQTWKLSIGNGVNPPYGRSGCTDPGTQHRDGGNPS
ncbi:unnamed protein product, partial [Staurois parvus]